MRGGVWIWLVLMACCSAAWAQERVSPKAVEAVRDAGRARVLVMLEDSAHSVQAKAAASPKARMQLVRAQVDNVLGDLGPLPAGAVLRRFETIPALVLDASPDLMARLARHRGVRRVDLDDRGGGGHASVAPDAASVLNHLQDLGAQGYAGQGMKVAIIDSGVDTDHGDLRSSLVAEQCFCTNAGGGGCCPNGQAQQSGPGAAEDDHGHGTNVSGIVVGDGHLAPRGAVPEAQLVAIKVLDRNNRFCCTSDIIAALDWLAAHHPDVDVVNLSLGTADLFPGDCDNTSSWTMAVAASVAALNAAGAVVTASTGNEGDHHRAALPACVRDVVGVAATWDGTLGRQTALGCTDPVTSARQPTCFSNRSPTTDLFAAGAWVTSTGRNGGISTYGGTSQAAPMVAACAVALKQAVPAATVQQRMDAMTLSLRRLNDPSSGRDYPFLDCADAVRLLDPAAWKPMRRNGAHPLVPR